MKVLTYRASRAAREPIRYDMGDGRSWEFPGDLPSDVFLTFLDDHGEQVQQGIWGFTALRDFFNLIAKLQPAVVAETTLSEFGAIAGDLFNHYLGIDPEAAAAAAEGDGQVPTNA